MLPYEEDYLRGEKMMDEKLENFIDDLYERNPFVHLLGMKLEFGCEEYCLFSMALKRELHGNAHNQAHGGATFSLADTAMGASCAFLNKKVVTQNMQISYFSTAQLGSTIFARTKLLHNGRRTVGLEVEIKDNMERLIAKASGSFFVIGHWVEDGW